MLPPEPAAQEQTRRGLRLLSRSDGSVTPLAGAHRSPLLVASIDGVGEKLRLAALLDAYDTIGQDAAALALNDVAASGAQPLFVTCSVAYGVGPEHVDRVVEGVAEACRIARCRLLASAATRSAALTREGEHDVCATAVGVVEEEHMLGIPRVREGDALVGVRSSGLHANGYTAVLSAVLSSGSARLHRIVEELESPRSLGEELLTPTPVYVDDCRALVDACDVHAFAPITGGGVVGNVSRVLPPTLDAVVDRSTWTPQPVFDVVSRIARMGEAEQERTFNMGVGLVVVLPAVEADEAVKVLTGRGRHAWVLGEVVAGDGRVRMVGAHPGRPEPSPDADPEASPAP